jgi:hypothetical protein
MLSVPGYLFRPGWPPDGREIIGHGRAGCYVRDDADGAGPMFRILAQPAGGVVTRSRVISAMPDEARVITSRRVTGAGYRPAGGATRLTSMTSSPRLLIRSIRPDRAPRSGSSARRVVVPGPMVTSQSSNSALSVVPACPRNVISYVFD